jgi:LPXTG-motif cell wall-anchored protein
MNVALPRFPGGADSQFWWVGAMMAGIAAAMLWYFKRRRWF